MSLIDQKRDSKAKRESDEEENDKNDKEITKVWNRVRTKQFGIG